MSLHQSFLSALEQMELWFRILESRVSPPRRAPFLNHFVFRYVEQTPHQALVQKLARNISGLHAARVLCVKGLFQEQATLERMLDEIQEDITFLTYGLTEETLSDLHVRFLESFFEEEFDRPEKPLESTQKRPSIPRQKIRAYLAKVEGHLIDPSRAVDLSRTLQKVYSGFLHAASTQIMDMYGGDPGRFYVKGMLGTPRVDEYTKDLLNYVYRGILAFGFAAMAFGDLQLFNQVVAFRNQFEIDTGMNHARVQPAGPADASRRG